MADQAHTDPASLEEGIRRIQEENPPMTENQNMKNITCVSNTLLITTIIIGLISIVPNLVIGLEYYPIEDYPCTSASLPSLGGLNLTIQGYLIGSSILYIIITMSTCALLFIDVSNKNSLRRGICLMCFQILMVLISYAFVGIVGIAMWAYTISVCAEEYVDNPSVILPLIQTLQYSTIMGMIAFPGLFGIIGFGYIKYAMEMMRKNVIG